MASRDDKFGRRILRALHRSSLLRGLAKRVCRGLVVRQPFHGGTICLDAVEHSWAWTGENRYETFDRPLQDALLRFSQVRPWLIDIGCNLGAMTLSVLLRNPRAHAVSVDPNPRAQELLERSLRANGLEGRAQRVAAAIAPVGAVVRFDFAGSVVGHVSPTGAAVATTSVAELLGRIPPGESPLFKVDVEGFETQFLPELIEAARARRAVLVLELHPLGMNGWGDPVRCFELLRASRAAIGDVGGTPLAAVGPADISQLVARWD